MSDQIISTKLYIPRYQPRVVLRPRLMERLNEGLQCKLTLISASAGFGKTTLLSEWIAGCGRPAAWMSLDEGDNDPARFLLYLVAALQTISEKIGEGVLGLLQSPQAPSPESIVTILLNDITGIQDKFILVLDDYHVINAGPVDDVIIFIIEHLPPQLHLVIATREDPDLPLARLRARGQLTELRCQDLRFNPSETAGFLNHVMDLDLSLDDITALEIRTEGWIAGLQLAAISIKGHKDVTGFIKTFTGSHRFIMDYLVEEVLQQQSETIRDFLLRTSILDRMCGPLCDALLPDQCTSSQETLEYLEHANLFIIHLDNDRCWYRYHHLFADFLRQRLHLGTVPSTRDNVMDVAGLHIRASIWYEDNSFEIEAFHHATAANDVERAERLVQGKGMPLHVRGVVAPVLNWLKSLPAEVLDARPSLWVMYASVLLVSGQVSGVEPKLQAAEAVLKCIGTDDKTDDLIGHIAAIRAMLAAIQGQLEIIINQSRRALEYLHPGSVAVRTATTWKLGYAYELQGDRTAASRAYTETISTSQLSGNILMNIMGTLGLGNMQELENHLYPAADTYHQALQLLNDQSNPPLACEAHLGLARIFYQWNDLETARLHGEKIIQLLPLLPVMDRCIVYKVFIARLKLAQGELDEAVSILTKAGQSARQHNFMHRIPEIAAVQILALLNEGNLAEAAHLAKINKLPLCQARVYLARGDATMALSVLKQVRQQVEAKGWEDERLKVIILQAIALQAHGENDRAIQQLSDALTLAEPGGFIRIFIDEGIPMAMLLSAGKGIMPDYTGRLLAVFESDKQKGKDKFYLSSFQPLVEPLSQR